jgi:hypothetical protein
MELEREIDLALDPAALDLLPAEQGLTGGCIFECEHEWTIGPASTACCGPPGAGTWCTDTFIRV